MDAAEEALIELGCDGDTRKRLTLYLEILMTANRELNLVSRKMTIEDLVWEHLLDSLIAVPYFPKAKMVADLGTGGGFPAIPLAIRFPEIDFYLYEKSPLKNRYLHDLADLFPNLHVAGPMSEDGLLPQTDLVIARGFKPISVIFSLTPSYLAKGGRYALFKARREKIEEEIKAVKDKKAEIRIQKLKPLGKAEERHLVLINP